jgi:two-component sensor histidine kinase
MIHERLYGEQQIDQIDFEEYTQTLLHELLVSYGDGTSRVTGRVEGAAVNLTVEQAIPCGLILNELVTNALKYAYPNGQSGDVVIYMEESPNGMVTLSVTDRGVGLPEGLDWTGSESMGLPMVSVLAQQIDGEMGVETRSGHTEFVIKFRKAKGT